MLDAFAMPELSLPAYHGRQFPEWSAYAPV